jgi:hypothetical protein
MPLGAALPPRLGKVDVSHLGQKGNKVVHAFAKLKHNTARWQMWRDILV